MEQQVSPTARLCPFSTVPVYSGEDLDFLRETVAHVPFAVHSDLMSDSGSGAPYFWCTRHHRVETEADVCPAVYVLGPYSSRADAESALQTVQERNEAWDEEDRRWAGEEK
jgi:hypothetical protein